MLYIIEQRAFEVARYLFNDIDSRTNWFTIGEAAISEPEQPASRNRTFRNTWNIPPWSDVIKDGLSEPSESISISIDIFSGCIF